jgi:TRAP-type C4-dicarboxylate transport system substrate-binding protein
MDQPTSGTDELEGQIQRRVGGRVRELRLAAGLTAVALAQRAGISQGQLSKIENGKAALSSKVLAALCRVLERPVGYLFQSRDEMPRVLGTLTTVEGPENEGIQGFAAAVREMTGGRLSLIPLRPSQLGSALSQVDQLREGLIDLFVEEPYYYDRFVAGFGVFALPYTFRSEAHRETFLAGAAFREDFVAPLQREGVRLLNRRWNWIRGLEWVLAADRPVTAPEDVRGLRVRTSESPLLQRFWEALGARPVAVPWAEVRAALRSGAVDVVPTHRTHLYPLGFCRYARFVTRLGDLPPVLAVGMHEARYRILPPGVQAGLEAACDRGGDVFSRRVRQAEEANAQLNIRRHKAVYLTVDVTPWREAVARARGILREEWLLPPAAWAAVAAADPGKDGEGP